MRTPFRVLIALAALTFLGAGAYLVNDYLTAAREAADLAQLQEQVAGLSGEVAASREDADQAELRNQVVGLGGDVIHLNGSSAGGGVASRFPEEPEEVLAQYAPLLMENPDIVGWIRIDGTPINYPVMQTPSDPEHYLRANWKDEYAYSGLPFLDARCDLKDPNCALLIYGHNMKNGSMFGKLPQYASEKFWSQHRVIHLDTLHASRSYEVIASFRSKAYKSDDEGFRYYDYIDLSKEPVYNSFIRQVEEQSLVRAPVMGAWGDQILMLSTCSYHTDDGTFVVVARRTQ